MGGPNCVGPEEMWEVATLRRLLQTVSPTRTFFPCQESKTLSQASTKQHGIVLWTLPVAIWQVEVEESEKWKTTFTTPFRLFEFERMPFGLCNAPATFQRLMQRCLKDHLTESAFVYLDDVMRFLELFSEHLNHLESIFQAVGRYDLKLSPEKCHLFQRQVKFLGRRQ